MKGRRTIIQARLRPIRGTSALLAVLLTGGLVQGCSSGSPGPPSTVPVVRASAAESTPGSGADDRNQRLQELAATTPPSPASGAHGGYAVGPDDLLRIDVFSAPELSGERRVSPEGDIALPLLGPLPVAGRSPRQLEDMLEEELGERYMKDPHVTIEVVEMGSHGVSVVGAVRQPGVYQLSEGTTLLEVLARAEGLEENAASTVLLIRNGATSADSSSLRIDLGELLAGGDLTGNVAVRPGDVVRVPEAGLVYVTGQVEEPGGFPVRRDSEMTAIQALSLAGGLTDRAAAGSSWIIRVDEEDRRRDIPVNLDEVLEENTENPKLLAGDVLYVPKSASKTILAGLWDALVRTVTLGTLLR